MLFSELIEKQFRGGWYSQQSKEKDEKMLKLEVEKLLPMTDGRGRQEFLVYFIGKKVPARVYRVSQTTYNVYGAWWKILGSESKYKFIEEGKYNYHLGEPVMIAQQEQVEGGK